MEKLSGINVYQFAGNWAKVVELELVEPDKTVKSYSIFKDSLKELWEAMQNGDRVFILKGRFSRIEFDLDKDTLISYFDGRLHKEYDIRGLKLTKLVCDARKIVEQE